MMLFVVKLEDLVSQKNKVGRFGGKGSVITDYYVDYYVVFLDFFFSILICREAISTGPPWLPRGRHCSR